MCDVASLSLDELRSLLSACMTRRIESADANERDRAGDDLIRVIGELDRRGQPVAAARTPRSPRVPAQRRREPRSAELRLPVAHRAMERAPGRSWFASD